MHHIQIPGNLGYGGILAIAQETTRSTQCTLYLYLTVVSG
jgi:hypothetical protein